MPVVVLKSSLGARLQHGRGRGRGAWVEGLELVGPKALLFEPDGQVRLVLVAGARLDSGEYRMSNCFLPTSSLYLSNIDLDSGPPSVAPTRAIRAKSESLPQLHSRIRPLLLRSRKTRDAIYF